MWLPAQAIKQAQESFQLDWAAAEASFAGQPPTDEQVRRTIRMVKSFTGQVNQIVMSESSKWIGDLEESLREADASQALGPKAQS